MEEVEYNDLFYVYRLSFKKHNRTYIGYTSTTPEKRFGWHWRSRNRINSPIAKCIRNVANKGDITIETLYVSWDKEAAIMAEIELIAWNKTLITETGLNSTIGGEHPSIFFDGRKLMEGKTDEEIIEINKKKSMPGDKNPFYGKTHDHETLIRAVETRRMNGSYANAGLHLQSQTVKEKTSSRKRELSANRAGFSSDFEFIYSIMEVYHKTAGSYRWIASMLGANRETVKSRIKLMEKGAYGDDVKDYINECNKYIIEDKKSIQIAGRETFSENFIHRVTREIPICQQ